jgi:RNA chaperone Hfq
MEEKYPGFEKWNKRQKQEKEQKPKYLERFNHRNVEVRLLNGSILRGKLHVNSANPYEVVVEIEGNRILVMKHAIATIAALKDVSVNKG